MERQPNGIRRKPLGFRPLHSFSLLTLFVALTAFACWLGYEMSWIRQRQEFMRVQAAQWPTSLGDATGGGITRPPGMLGFFGEQGYESVVVLVSKDTIVKFNEHDWAMIERARRLFPEAEMIYGELNQDGGLYLFSE